MFLATAIIAIIFFTSAGICQDISATSSVPTPNQFIADLFNTTIDKIGSVANNFTFVAVDPKNIQFIYYPKDASTDNPTTITDENSNILDRLKQTKIITHGWSSTATADWVKKIANTYNSKGKFNILAVNWTFYSSKNYFVSATAVQSVGNVLGDFVCRIFGKKISNVHLIGHSLGAHTSGFAGKRVRQQCKQVVARITGLDPAGPLFSNPVDRPAALRLDKTDGKFVDVIHTNGGFLGMNDDHGTCDFYPNNGGPIQPGCTEGFSSAIKLYPPIVCSHSKSQAFFTETILKPRKFQGLQCDNRVKFKLGICEGNAKAFMGDGVNENTKGNFYLSTENSNDGKNLWDRIFG